MSYAENKSLIEYGELNSMHHSDAQAEKEAGQRAYELEQQPAFLYSQLTIGGSYVILWSKGDAPVPGECQGLWTGAVQADNAIKHCMKRLAREAEQAAIAALDALEKEAKADKKPTTKKQVVVKK